MSVWFRSNANCFRKLRCLTPKSSPCPTRRAILARLAEGEATVGELAKPFVLSQPAISQHIKVLVEAGLILRRIDGTPPLPSGPARSGGAGRLARHPAPDHGEELPAA